MEDVTLKVCPTRGRTGVFQDSVPIVHHKRRLVGKSIREKDVLDPGTIFKVHLDFSSSVELRLHIRTTVPSLEICDDVVKDGAGAAL